MTLTDNQKKCSECRTEKTEKVKVDGKFYDHWYFNNKKRVCRNCWEKLSKPYKEIHNKKQKKYALSNKDKIVAHNFVNKNKLRGEQCEVCGIRNTRLEAHHFDYSKPDKIITLCVKCHKRIHNG